MMPEMSRAAWFMPGTAISMSASWSKGRSRRRTPAAKPRCRTTTGLLSPVPSAARGSTTRMSATISNASGRSLRWRTAVARATPTRTRTKARASPRAAAKAKKRAKVDVEATRQVRQGQEPGQVRGHRNPTPRGKPKPSVGQQSPGPTTRSQTQAQKRTRSEAWPRRWGRV